MSILHSIDLLRSRRPGLALGSVDAAREFNPAEQEWMDGEGIAAGDLATTLAELESLNEKFGGHAVLLRFLRQWMKPGESYRVLDLCCGSGDGARAMVRWAREQSVTLAVEGIDANPETVRVARQRSREFPEIRYAAEDALRAEPEGRYDLVLCSLALHHFSASDAIAMLRRCSELTRRWALVVDLERSVFTSAAIWLATTLFCRHAATAHDGEMSARRAFSHAEFAALAQQAGWGTFGHRRFIPCRQAIWMERA